MAALGSMGLKKRIAIVGAGPLGLIAAKNLVEEGFEVIVFERTQYVGGLWKPTSNTGQTSVLPGTITNTSKFTGAMTDFPMPDSYPIYPGAEQIQEYFESYSLAFNIKKYIRFNAEVVQVTRNHASSLWQVSFRSASDSDGKIQTLIFDRLIIATGSFQKPTMARFKGIDGFEGEILHSQAFKDPAKYRGKTVLVVGVGNTAADSISALLKVGVKRVVVSHRHKVVILPRITKDQKILEFTLTFRLLRFIFFLQTISEKLAATIMANELRKIQHDNFPGLHHHRVNASDRVLPSPKQIMPTVSDDLAGHFLNGSLESAPGVHEINGPRSVRFVDGTELRDVDVILMCTGLSPDLASLVPEEVDPYNTDLAPKTFEMLPARYTDNRRVARLYQGFISPQCPHQLAFLGVTFAKRPAFQLYDLMTMALAQLWSGNYPMPPQDEMDRVADDHVAHVAHLIKNDEVKVTGIMGAIEFDQWMNKVAGTELYNHLGSWTSPQCWKLWWNDRELYNTMMGGIISTHALRLFENREGRKAWPGARRAIMKANEEASRWKPEKNNGLW